MTILQNRITKQKFYSIEEKVCSDWMMRECHIEFVFKDIGFHYDIHYARWNKTLYFINFYDRDGVQTAHLSLKNWEIWGGDAQN